jgi:hypothetical protein
MIGFPPIADWDAPERVITGTTPCIKCGVPQAYSIGEFGPPGIPMILCDACVARKTEPDA